MRISAAEKCLQSEGIMLMKGLCYLPSKTLAIVPESFLHWAGCGLTHPSHIRMDVLGTNSNLGFDAGEKETGKE